MLFGRHAVERTRFKGLASGWVSGGFEPERLLKSAGPFGFMRRSALAVRCGQGGEEGVGLGVEAESALLSMGARRDRSRCPTGLRAGWQRIAARDHGLPRLPLG